MLNFLGTLGGKALSFPGIFGLALGMMTRRLWLAVLLGALVGAVETLMFAGWDMGQIVALDIGLAIGVGAVAGAVGCMIRRHGTTV